MTEKVKLEVEIDLMNLRRCVSSDHDDGPVYEPMTLEEAVVAEAGRIIVNQYASEMRTALGQAAREGLGQMVLDALRPMVTDAIEQAIQPTSGWGEPKGEPLTLREVIVKQATDELKAPRQRDGYGSRQETLVQAVIRETVERSFRAELVKAVDEAKKQVAAAVQEKGAEVIAETITKLAGVR